MPSLNNFRVGVSRLFFLTILLCAPTLASAETSYWVGVPSFQRDFVLAGDSQDPAREGVAVRTSVLVSTTTTEWASYRFAWQLEVEDENGDWSQVALSGSDTVQSASQTILLTADTSDEFESAEILQFAGSLTSEQTLDPYANYRIIAQLQRQPAFTSGYSDVEDPTESSGKRLYQFTNSISGDNARNVIATVDSASLGNPFLLDGASSSANRSFTVDVEATARRWDAYGQSAFNSTITFRYEVELRDANTGTVVPVANSSINRARSIRTYNDSDSVPIPSITSFTDTLSIRPLQQLDPVNGNYEVSVTITHIEETSPSQVIRTGNSRLLENLRLFHFNGAINFSGISAVIKSFSRSPQPATSDSASYVSMTLSNLSGHLSGKTGYTYAAPANVNLRLYPDGTAVVQGVGAAIPVTPPTSPDIGSAGNVRFVRNDMTLTPGGLSGSLLVYLPQGMGYSTSANNRNLSGTINFGSQALDNQLTPVSEKAVFNPGSTIHVVEETKPASIPASAITWSTATGEFNMDSPGSARYVRDEEAAFLFGSPLPEPDRIKADNAGYYTALTSISGNTFLIETAADSSAKLSTEFNFGGGQFVTHFPYGATVLFDSGVSKVQQDSVAGGLLNNVAPLTLGYQQDCVGDDCGDGGKRGRFIVDVKALQLTTDGGLIGAGGLIEDAPGDTTLSWGLIDALSKPGDPVYAHSLSGFSAGTFHATGHFIPGDGGEFSDFFPDAPATETAEAGPGAIHLSAAYPDQSIARPGSAADRAGTHYYAGVNLEVGNDGDVLALATVAGQTVSYTARGCNKFYVRQIGVSGTLEAVPGSFPSNLTLYGYKFSFDYYGLGFLDSNTSPQRSFTAGSMLAGGPTDEVFEFEGLSFTCLGGLDAARLPDGGLEKRLAYWNADIDVGSLAFVTSDSCNPASDAFAALGVSAYSTLIDQPLHGVIGIRPNGQLIHRDFSQAENLETEITSRLRLPNRIEMDGPNDEVYELTAISEAYFNDHASASSAQERATGNGRLNFAAKTGVPFFEDLAVHVRTTASKNFNPDATVHLMGGWEENAETYFTSSFFDPGNRAFPPGETEAVYRNDSGAGGDPSPYLIHARQEWLNVVPFDYPLEWSSSLRSFTAYEPTTETNLLVVTIDHQLDYLSADNAEITFGAAYDGLPRISLTNFAFNAIDEGTGVLQAITGALQAEAVGALDDGLDSMAKLLDDQVDALLEEFLVQTVDPIVDKLYTGLDPANNTIADINAWKTHVTDETSYYLMENVAAGSDNVHYAIGQLSQGVDDASSLIHEVNTSLEKVQIALRAIHGEIYRVNGEIVLEAPAVPNPADTFSGLLTQQGEEFPIVGELVARLIDEVAGELGNELANTLNNVLEGPTAELNRLINEQLDQVRPTLERLIVVIEKLDDRIGDARDELTGAGDFLQELDAILTAADSQILTATTRLQETIETFLIADIPSPDQFEEYTAAELKQRIRQEIQDELRQLAFIREYQLVLRQRLYDLDLAIKEGIDTAFAQVNTTLKNLLREYLAQFDDQINGFLGDLGENLGAGQLDGFAHITGDALRLLRIDAYLQLKVPEDMEFNGYLQIKQLRSDGTGTCSYGPEGTLSTEITMGAFGVPVSWISPGMELDVDGKVTFTDRPVGLGGSIEMVEGEFGFETFTITELGAAMSFGATENYLAAEVGLVFQSYSVYGGVFFGRTCTIEPLELVNPQVAGILGDPPFTGAYVYGEAHIPVSEALLGIPASCMFKITAGVGAGAFYFVEGPTFGGQILLAVSGEALCLVGIKGDLSLVGVKVADDLRFSGRGRLSGRVGSCPFCVKFGKTLQLEYANDRWSFEL